MNKRKIIIGVLFIILLSLLFVSCQSNDITQQTEEPIHTEVITVNSSSEPVATETEVPIEKTDIVIQEIDKPSSVKQIESITPEPVEINIPERENICNLTVRCDDIIRNIDNLKNGKEAFIPENGIVLSKQEVVFSPGESVFDVLYRLVKEKGIHMEFVDTPMYNSVYIEGIANLYEFDCGKNSGWVYTVNGESPMHGCSQHKVSQGDNIEFVYKCNLFD